MSEYYCPNCGTKVEEGTKFCSNCGIRVEGLFDRGPQQQQYEQRNTEDTDFNGFRHTPYYNGVDPNWPVKSKIAAGVLGIVLGGLGIHKFYLGRIGLGILYILFCWTGIPSIIGLVEGIIYLCTDDLTFQLKHRVRLVE